MSDGSDPRDVVTDGDADVDVPDRPTAEASEGTGADRPADEGEATDRELQARLAALELENERLRDRYASTRRAAHHRSAVALAVLGLLALGGAVVFPAVRTVLIAIGATGLFGAVLTAYLTPERFVAASVGERIYRATDANYAAIAAELGLSDERVYVPTGGGETPVRLFVPRAGDYAIPSAEALADVFVVTPNERERGLSLTPAGTGLYEEFTTGFRTAPADALARHVDQLVDAIVEGFELADAATAEVENGRVTIGFDATVYGPLDGVDHPLVSFLAVGVARFVDEPVTASVVEGDERYERLVALTWDQGG